jgi:hypothetical protein
MMPMQADLIAIGDDSGNHEGDPIISQPKAGKKRKPPRYVGSYETRFGNYYLHQKIGEFGNDVENVSK